MADPFIGEIRLFAGNFAPVDWAFCDGRTMAIAGNEALFNLLGTIYGGDGINTFNLPDLRSRVPVHGGSGYVIGQPAGSETVTILAQHMPPHEHALMATDQNAVLSPNNALPGKVTSQQGNAGLYGTSTADLTALTPASVTPSMGGQPHGNIQPYLAVSFIISLAGLYPSQG